MGIECTSGLGMYEIMAAEKDGARFAGVGMWTSIVTTTSMLQTTITETSCEVVMVAGILVSWESPAVS
jgi:hypothetical protein